MNNTLTDLNNILFEQLERLNDDDLKGEELNAQIKKSTCMHKIASTIVQNANLQFKAYQESRDISDSSKHILGIEE